jgi:hypothetical protein
MGKRKASSIDAPTGAVGATTKGMVISCFDLTGRMVKDWAARGYDCHIVDIQHPAGKTTVGNITKWGMDVYEWEKVFFRDYTGASVHFASFFPPCTDLAVSGARWFASKEKANPGTRKRAMELIHWSNRMGAKLKCPYFIENPVSVISSEWRQPDFRFHPYEYGGYHGGAGDGYTKTTCLWVGGDFALPDRKPIKKNPKIVDKIWRMAPGPDRANARSATAAGFARACFEHYSLVVEADWKKKMQKDKMQQKKKKTSAKGRVPSTNEQETNEQEKASTNEQEKEEKKTTKGRESSKKVKRARKTKT